MGDHETESTSRARVSRSVAVVVPVRGRGRADARLRAPRTAPARPARSSPPPRWRPRSRRSSPSTAPDRARASVTRQRSATSRRPANVRRASVAVGGETPDRHQPAHLEMRQLEKLRHRRIDRVGREAGLRRIAVDVDLDQDRIATAGSRLGDEAVEPPGELRPNRPTRSRRRPPAPGAPCSTGAARRGASGRPAPAGTLATASWTRFSPSRSRPAATASRSASGGTVFETATRVTPAGSRPARAQAAAIRARTSARAARYVSIRDPDSVIGRPPALAGAGHFRRRKLGISRSSAS